jgi:stearoyl-CoA desaturase (delta-9 desaturase)
MTTARAPAPIDPVTTTLFSLTFLLAVVGVPIYGFLVGYSAGAWATFAAFLVASGVSITAGYHRLWSHRAFEAHWSVRLFFMLFGAMSIQNSIYVWSALHRPHHRFVDDEETDPYSIRRGLWFAHMGWMLRRHPSGEPDFKYVRDLERDPIVMFQHRHYVPIVLVMNIAVPLLVGFAIGDPIGTLLLAGGLRMVINHHATFFINSLAHWWGTRPYTDDNTARDNPVLAFLTYGEGYHNFHHKFASDYRNGIRWWQWDPTKWLIWSLSHLGLAQKLRVTPAVSIEHARLEMEFKRARERLERRAAGPDWHQGLATLRDHLAHEYDAFRATLAEWSAAREAWMTQTRERVAEQFAHVDLKAYAREIEERLRTQRRRLEMLTLQLA